MSTSLIEVSEAATGGEAVADLLRQGADLLRQAGVERPRFEAELLLSAASGCGRHELAAHPEASGPPDVERLYRGLLRRRLAREPLAYVLGDQPFFGRSFVVDRRALVPRPETELLVELGLAALDRLLALRDKPWVLDVGTGCGAIAVSVALARPQAAVVGTDISWEALRLARVNAARLGATGVSFVQADLLSPFIGPMDLVLANLPYVPKGRLDQLEPELLFEPATALSPGPLGTELIVGLLKQARRLLRAGSEVLIEVDESQGPTVCSLASDCWPDADCEVIKDYAGLDRVLHVRPL